MSPELILFSYISFMITPDIHKWASKDRALTDFDNLISVSNWIWWYSFLSKVPPYMTIWIVIGVTTVRSWLPFSLIEGALYRFKSSWSPNILRSIGDGLVVVSLLLLTKRHESKTCRCPALPEDIAFRVAMAYSAWLDFVPFSIWIYTPAPRIILGLRNIWDYISL